MHSLPETDEFNTLGIPQDIGETNTIIENWIADHQQEIIENFTFAIEKIADNQFVGLIALNRSNSKFNKAEIWYKLNSVFWKQGYATEAVNSVINFGFKELNLHRIEAGCAVDNIGSIKLLEKVRMKKEGRKRKILPLKTGWSDNFIYAILEEDIRSN
jgi:RimJ/RimL family protein N-acetyltransferase